jgi:hypothetical protein
MCSQTPNNAPVTAPTSVDTPKVNNPELRLQYERRMPPDLARKW